jgi:hypothetical protein
MAMRRVLFYLSIVATVGYGGLLIWKTSFAVGGSDSAGYTNTAKRIVEGRIVQPIEALDHLELPDRFNRVFMPLAHEPGPRPRTMVPFYPPGFPLHLAAAGILGGWEYAPHFVSPIAALLLVLGTYFLARELSLSRPLAFLSAAILAGSAVLLCQAEQAMSDVVAALWTTAAVFLALRSRRSPWWAMAAGAAFGMAVLVRPTNVILALPLSLALPWRSKPLGLFAAGGLPFAAFEFWWNTLLFGGPLRTGYGGLGDFKMSNFPERFVHYARTLAAMFSPLVPLGWLAAAGDRRVPLRDRMMLFLWFAPCLLLYCFWGPYEAWWYTRYLLPAFPALTVAAVLAARDVSLWVSVRSGKGAVALAVCLLVVVVLFERRGYRRWKPLDIAEGQKIYPMAMDFVRSKLPERSLVVSMQMSGALRYYTGSQPVRWDWLQPGDFAEVVKHARQKGYGVYALLAPFEVDEKALSDRAPGNWKVVGAIRDVKLWELED